MDRDEVRLLLACYRTGDAAEAAMVRRTLEFVEREPDPCNRRRTEVGHITASAWVIDVGRSAAVLVHHAALGQWFQPGGHIEPDDAGLLPAAMREAREETGLDVTPEGEGVFDVDVHTIPPRGESASHLHFDVRFALLADRESRPRASAESREVRWVDLGEVERYTLSESVLRMARKTLGRGGAARG